MNHLKEKLWPPFRLAMSVAVALRHFQKVRPKSGQNMVVKVEKKVLDNNFKKNLNLLNTKKDDATL